MPLTPDRRIVLNRPLVTGRRLVQGRTAIPSFVDPEAPPPDPVDPEAPPPTPDPGPSAPVITNLRATTIGQTSLVVAWNLDQYATGVLKYGTSSPPETTRLPSENTLNWNHHQQTISGLTPDELYYLQAFGTNVAEQEGSSSIIEVTTLEADDPLPPDPESPAYGPGPTPATPTGGHVHTLTQGGGVDLTGSSRTDVAVNAWIAALPNGTPGQHTVGVIPSGSTLRLGRSLVVTSSKRYIDLFMYGATLDLDVAIAGSLTSQEMSDHRGCTIVLRQCRDIRLRGGEIDGGWHPGGSTDQYSHRESEHGISFFGDCPDITVEDMYIHHNYGDNIYQSAWGKHDRSVIRRCTLERAGRVALVPNGGGDDRLYEGLDFVAPAGCGILWEDIQFRTPKMTAHRQTFRSLRFRGWHATNIQTWDIQSAIKFDHKFQSLDNIQTITFDGLLFQVGMMGWKGPTGSGHGNSNFMNLHTAWGGHKLNACGIGPLLYNATIKDVVIDADVPTGLGGLNQGQASYAQRGIKVPGAVGLVFENTRLRGMSRFLGPFTINSARTPCSAGLPYTVPASTSVSYVGTND